jgi:hypothetical protein
MWNHIRRQWDYFALAFILALYVTLGAVVALDLVFITVL